MAFFTFQEISDQLLLYFVVLPEHHKVILLFVQIKFEQSRMILYQIPFSRKIYDKNNKNLKRMIYDKTKVKPHKKARQRVENCPKIEPQDSYY